MHFNMKCDFHKKFNPFLKHFEIYSDLKKPVNSRFEWTQEFCSLKAIIDCKTNSEVWLQATQQDNNNNSIQRERQMLVLIKEFFLPEVLVISHMLWWNKGKYIENIVELTEFIDFYMNFCDKRKSVKTIALKNKKI